jgi:hypothetical protein
MATQIRGATQLVDDSVTFEKLDPAVREYVQRGWTEATFAAEEGQTAFLVSGLTGAEHIEVYRNGLLSQLDEYVVTPGQVEFDLPMLSGEQVRVFYGIRTAAVPGVLKLGVDA